MDDISGELFIALDTLVKRRNHAAQRTGQAANLVGARTEIRDTHAGRGHFPRVFVATDFSGRSQIGQRV